MEPIIPKKFPTSVAQLLTEHNQLGLNKLRLADKKHWDGSVRSRYSRRQSMFEAIERKAQILRSPSDIAARSREAKQGFLACPTHKLQSKPDLAYL